MSLSTFGFALCVTFLLIHEADAIRRHEWRLFAGLNRLPEESARLVFQLLHVPIYLVILYFGFLEPDARVQAGLAGFMIVHLGLHLLLRQHPNNEFAGFESWSWIVGSALGGLLYFLG